MSASLRSPAPTGAQRCASGRGRLAVPQRHPAPQDPQGCLSRSGTDDEPARRVDPAGRPGRPSGQSRSGPRLGLRRVAAGLAAVCALALGVAACSLKDAKAVASASASSSASAAVARAEKGIADANASATASREAALTPELKAKRDAALAEPAPVKPLHMDEETAEGAVASVYYFLDLYRYAFMTGNTTELANISEDQCKFCQSAIERATELHSTGGWIDKWDQNIVDTTYYEKLEGYNYNRISVTVNYGEMTSHPGDGSAGKVSEKDDGRVLNFGVRYVNGGWSIGGVEVTKK